MRKFCIGLCKLTIVLLLLSLSQGLCIVEEIFRAIKSTKVKPYAPIYHHFHRTAAAGIAACFSSTNTPKARSNFPKRIDRCPVKGETFSRASISPFQLFVRFQCQSGKANVSHLRFLLETLLRSASAVFGVFPSRLGPKCEECLPQHSR